MELDKDLQKQAHDWATNIIEQFNAARKDPEKPLTGELLDLYRELKTWGFYDVFDMMDHGMHVYRFLALTRYRHLKWHKEHPPKPQRSKWEIVTGKK